MNTFRIVYFLWLIAVNAPACGRTAERPPLDEAKGAVSGGTPTSNIAAATMQSSPLPKNDAVSSAKPATSGRTRIDMSAATYLSLDENLTRYALLLERVEIDGAGDSAAALLQDDNLLTHVACPVGDGAPCVIKIELPVPALVSAVRMFSGKGESRKDFASAGKPARVRVRTDAAEGEARLDDRWDFNYIVFSQPVQTKFVQIEILSTHAKKKSADASIAALDLLGEIGTPRPSLYVDWQHLYAKSDGNFWRGDKFSDSWNEQIDIKGTRQRLFRGAVVHGAANRRFLIAERIVRVDCPGAAHVQESRYTLIDTRSRMFYALPPLRGMITISPRQVGEGFLLDGYVHEPDQYVSRAIVIDNEQVRTLDLSVRPQGSVQKELVRLGFSPVVLPHNIEKNNLYGASRPCKSVSRINKAIRKAISEIGIDKEYVSVDAWEKCTVPDGRTVYLYNDLCSDDNPAAVAIQQPGGDVVVKSFSNYSTVDLRVFGDGSVRISAERRDGAAGDIFDLNDEGTLKLLIKDALFHPGQAPNCRCSA